MEVLDERIEVYEKKINTKKAKVMLINNGKVLVIRIGTVKVERVKSSWNLGNQRSDDRMSTDKIKGKIAMEKESYNRNKTMLGSHA